MIENRKQMFIVIGAFILTLLLGSTTYAFFNYIRTGAANAIKTGRISFTSTQDGNIILTNSFPITSQEAETDTTNAKSVAITVTGDTDYTSGVEYLVTASDVNLSVNNKQLPIALEISVTGNNRKTLGTLETGDYYENRDSYTVSKYKIEYDGEIEEGSHLLVGYIAPNETSGTASGIDGIINIKAYIDKNRILISDTYPSGDVDTNNDNETDYSNGTPATDKTVFTTAEWNSIQNSPLSFKVTVESNEGIWIKEPPVKYEAGVKCQRITKATKLHTEICNQTSNYCASDGYTGTNALITYGNAKTLNSTLVVGDAFDCDVNGNGIVDVDESGKSTERFYYVSEYYNTNNQTFDDSTGYASLIYYRNFVDGLASDDGAAYDLVHSAANWYGPVTAVTHLPTSSTWSNITLKTTNRTILACTYSDCSSSPVETISNWGVTQNIENPFNYSGKAARFLTLLELKHAGCDTLSNQTSFNSIGSLKACNFLLEGTKYADKNKPTYGTWLETLTAGNSTTVWSVYAYNCNITNNNTHSTSGVRPTIDVPYSKILY